MFSSYFLKAAQGSAEMYSAASSKVLGRYLPSSEFGSIITFK